MNAGEYHGFTVAIEDPGIAVLTFNEPERLNGMTLPLKRDMMELLAQAQMDDAIRVVLFTGSGKAFSAGDDISGIPREKRDVSPFVPDIPHGFGSSRSLAMGTYNGLRWLSQQLNVTIRALDKLTIAAINGYAIQTGLSLALSCDFRIAATDAKIGSGTLRFGLQPDEGGHYLIVKLLGVARAMDFLMLNRIVSGEEALELGLVHEAVKPEALMPRAKALATQLANGPQMSMRMLKRAIYNAAELTFAQALDDIATKTAITDCQADAEEGMAAFREKRQPVFNEWLGG